MSAAKIAISIEARSLQQVDQLVREGLFPNRSRLIQSAVSEKLERLHGGRLARECAKLDPVEEKATAEELLVGEVEWPAY